MTIEKDQDPVRRSAGNRWTHLVLPWGLAASTAAWALFLAFPSDLGGVPGSFPSLLLVVAAGLAGRLAVARAGKTSVRLALCFVLAAEIFFPAPAGIWAALAAALFSLGAGLAGPAERTPFGFAAALAGILVAHHARAWLGGAVPTESPDAILALLLHLALVQSAAAALAALFRRLPGPDNAAATAVQARRLLLEGVNVLPAWALGSLLVAERSLPALALVAGILVAAWGIRVFDGLTNEMTIVRRDLVSRTSELKTLDAIAREIPSSADIVKLRTIIDRECRKLFDVDLLFIATVDRATQELRCGYRRRDEQGFREDHRALGQDLASWIVNEKRGLCVRDATSYREWPCLESEFASGPTGSVMAAPLLAGDRAIGVLGVLSGNVGAYDEHSFSLLVTIAQQVSFALERARQHESAAVDAVTGLYVREFFLRRLDEEYQRSRRYHNPFALLMGDLDAFKKVNDLHGHLTGDRYLKAVAGTIEKSLRAADVACRFGGDEFCVLLPETHVEGARVIAERIREAVSQLHLDSDGLDIRTTLSLGLAAFPDHDTGDLRGLLLRADQALYRAKRAGRDRVILFAA